MKELDFVVIGSGIAGLSFAIKAAKHGRVAIITKRQGVDSNTAWAQGGLAWRGQYNVFDARLHTYFAGHERVPGPKQTRPDWLAAWGPGPAGEQESMLLTGPAAKTLTVEGTTQAALLQQLGRLYLPDQLRGDPKQPGPPGANLAGLGIFK